MLTYGLIGKSLKHSFSAGYFNERFAQSGLEAQYLNFELADISQASDLLVRPDLKGLNVTIPYKEAIIPYLSAIDSVAAEIGAVNTLKPTSNGWVGYNTDHLGFRDSFLAAVIPTRLHELLNKPALILGTGGASKAVAYALKQLGFDICYASTSQTGQVLLAYADLIGRLPDFGLIVNTTPLGTWPEIDAMPPVPVQEFSHQHHLFDLIYNPPITSLMAHAAANGATTQNGKDMLIRQANAAWTIWNNG